MADQENLEMDDVLERITFYCFEQAQGKLEAGDECTPFTVVVDGDQMFEETFPADDIVSCRKGAEANVKSSSSFSSHYAFCYDGFLMTDNGQVDALIVECATRDMEKAYVIARLYKENDGVFEFDETPAYVDDVESFYDAATVKAVKSREEVLAQEGAEMEDVQDRISRLLRGDEE